MSLFQRILVALPRDPALAHPVLAEAIVVAQGQDALLNLMQVMLPLDGGYATSMSSSLGGAIPAINASAFEATLAQWQGLYKSLEATLKAQVAEAQSAGPAAESTLVVGDPGRQICTIAKNWNADLIVVGRRGLRGLGQILLGSVSSYVMHHSPCAVLIVQGDAPAITTAASADLDR